MIFCIEEGEFANPTYISWKKKCTSNIGPAERTLVSVWANDSYARLHDGACAGTAGGRGTPRSDASQSALGRGSLQSAGEGGRGVVSASSVPHWLALEEGTVTLISDKNMDALMNALIPCSGVLQRAGLQTNGCRVVSRVVCLRATCLADSSSTVRQHGRECSSLYGQGGSGGSALLHESDKASEHTPKSTVARSSMPVVSSIQSMYCDRRV